MLEDVVTISDKTPGKMEKIRCSDIRESKTALRGIDRKSATYKELVASVQEHGVIECITVRSCKDENNVPYFGLINGLQRLTASRDCGLEYIDAKVISATDYEVLEKQIILNVQRVETKGSEYSKALSRLILMNPVLTQSELARKIGKSPAFITDRLSLLDLTDGIAKLVDDGQIVLANAFALAKLPPIEQEAFKERAMTQTTQEFAPQAVARAKQIADDLRKGKAPTPATFKPEAHLRKAEEVKKEYEKAVAMHTILSKENASSAEDGWKAAIKWAVNMDTISLEVSKAKYDARKSEEEAKKKQRAAERAAQAPQKALTAAVESTFGVKGLGLVEANA